ncbi:MAG: hypothetical protein ACPL7D_07000 [Candidatus Sumerlaeaceae bacterium]
MSGKAKYVFRFVALAATLTLALSGCRACVRESVVWQHTFRTPAQKACPRIRPEYELPPGGPYLEKPIGKGYATTKKVTIPEKTSGEITVTTKQK